MKNFAAGKVGGGPSSPRGISEKKICGRWTNSLIQGMLIILRPADVDHGVIRFRLGALSKFKLIYEEEFSWRSEHIQEITPAIRPSRGYISADAKPSLIEP